MIQEMGPLLTAMITPFNSEGNINYEEVGNIATHLVKTGTDTIVVAGTTGESPTLSHEEERQLFLELVRAKGSAKIMAGTGSNCTKTAIKETQEAESIGVDFSLQVVPYYNKPTQEGLIAHFSAIARSTSLPILLYNIPGRTGINMAADTTAELSDIKNIVGIKEASGSTEQVKKIRERTSSDFLIYSGDDSLTVPFMKEGACGCVSVAAHIVGDELKEIIQQMSVGNQEKAEAISNRLAPLFDCLFKEPNPVPIKAALNLLGFNVGETRLPLLPISQPILNELKLILGNLNKL